MKSDFINERSCLQRPRTPACNVLLPLGDFCVIVSEMLGTHVCIKDAEEIWICSLLACVRAECTGEAREKGCYAIKKNVNKTVMWIECTFKHHI